MSAIFSDISVVIPVYNQGTLLLECLASIYNMDYPPAHLEVIVVDDCSTEDIGSIVHSRFPGVKVIRRSENGGCDAAREDGIRAATGEVIANTDADCVVSTGWARRINKCIQSGTAAVTGPVIHDQSLMAQFIAITQFGHFQSRKGGSASLFPGCNFAVTKDMADTLRYLELGLRDGADRLLARKIADAGYRMVYDPMMIIRHYPPLSLCSLWKRWRHYSYVTYMLRYIDPKLPGGKLLRAGPLAPGIMAAARLGRDYQRLCQLALAERLRPIFIPPLAVLFPIMRLIDALRMFEAYVGTLRTRGHESDSLSTKRKKRLVR